MTARIVKDEEFKGLWMMIDGEDQTAWPITHEEVKPIMRACQKYLEEHD